MSLSNNNIWGTRGKHAGKIGNQLQIKAKKYKGVILITPHYVNQIHFFEILKPQVRAKTS